MITSRHETTWSSYQPNNLSATDIARAHFNNIMSYLHFFSLYKKRYQNFFSVVYKVLRKKYQIQAILRDGSQKEFSEYIQVFYDLRDIHFEIDRDVLNLNNMKSVGGKNNGDIVHIFIDQEYSFLPVCDRVVLDIGANIADSSIYFASRGAKMGLCC